MRRFGSNRKNPNPPWPYEQSVVVIPKGSNPSAIGIHNQKSRTMPEAEVVVSMNDTDTKTVINNENISENERFLRLDPIMGNINEEKQIKNNYSSQTNKISTGVCASMNVNQFLCGMQGKYVKIEFMFGENTHMEKSGVLEGVGKDFVAIRESGSDNMVVCGTGKIKFINIFGTDK